MFSCLINRLIFACLLLGVASARGDEENLWPVYVRRSDPEHGKESIQALGPLVFARTGPAEELRGIRPFSRTAVTADGEVRNLVYPFFTWSRYKDGGTAFSFFHLVNKAGNPAQGHEPAEGRFDVWPFYFSRDTGNPVTSYQAFFPFGGTVKNRFGHDRITFTVFPVYMQTEKAGKQITHAPWPFLRFISGDGHQGFEFWPLAGHSSRPGDYERRFLLWPLVMKTAEHLSEPTPDRTFSVLPFYARSTGPGYIRENYVWPFFGYSQVKAPYRYEEVRYFWPLFVQGHGDSRMVNRWAPLYSHSIIKGTEKTWVLWPLFRNQRWAEGGLAQQKESVLFFLYWSLEQRSLARPDAAPAHKTHLWPLFSAWDNGAGSRQVQVLSPIEVFFPHNDIMRQLWSPLFALYRYDHQPDQTSRHSLLWDAVTWRHSPQEREFHLGPLFSVQANPAQKRIALGNGVLGLRRLPGERWRFFLFDFPRKTASKAEPAQTP
jgi:hypothetical protein